MFWKKRKNGGKRKKVDFLLENDSHERLIRLRNKIPGYNDDEILAEAFKCLEQKIERIIEKLGKKTTA